MKKFLIALFTIFACSKTFAEPVGGFIPPIPPIYAHPDVVEYAIKKYVVAPYDPNKVTAAYEQYMNQNDGTITLENLQQKVCPAGGMDKTRCKEFTDALMIYYYDVCDSGKGKSGGNEHCEKNFFYYAAPKNLSFGNGTYVRIKEAIGLAQEYALVKDKQKVVCVSTKGNSKKTDTIWCTSIDKKHFYEFKFNNIKETKDDYIKQSVLRAVCKMYNTTYTAGSVGVATIGDAPGLSYPDSCETDNQFTCGNINKSLSRFSYKSQIGTSDVPPAGKHTTCVIERVIKDVSNLRTAYGIDNTVFKNVQVLAGEDVDNKIKQYVKQELQKQKITFNEKSFHCSGSTNVISAGEVITCYVNDKPVDFLFADLSEEKDYAKNAGLSKMACVQLGGKVDQKKCRGLDEQECNKLGNRLIARGEQGTKYLPEKGGCILSAAATERAINLAKEIVAGIAITVVTDGAATIPVIVSIGTDLAFEAVQIWQDEIPYKDFKEFMAAAEECENITRDSVFGNDSIKNQKKYCMGSVLNKYAKLMTSQIQNLAPEVQAELITRMTQISDMVGDQEIVYVIPTAKAMRNYASFALFGGLLVFNPEKWFSKADNMASEFTRLQLKASKSFKTYALEFLSLGNNVGLPIERLTQKEWAALNRHLSNQGVEMFETIMKGQRVMTFKLSFVGLKSKASQNFDKYLNEFLQTGSSAGLPAGRMSKSEWDELNNLLKPQNVKLTENGGYMYFSKMGAELSDFAGLRNKASQNFDKYLNEFLQTGSSAGLPAGRMSKSEWDKLNEFLKPQGVKLTESNSYMYFTKIGSSLSSAKQQLLNLGFRETSNGVLISDKYETIFYDEFNAIVNKKAITMSLDGSSDGRQIVVAISDDDASKLGLHWSDTENDFLIPTSENASNLSRLSGFISQRKQLTNIHGNPVYITEFGARSGRPIVMVEIKGRQIPFYISTGLAGKTTVPTGKWEFFAGIGPTNWFNKGSLRDVENHYDSQELRQIANALDNQIGDLRNMKYFLNSSGRHAYRGQGFVGTIENAPELSNNIINSGFNYAPGVNGSSAPTRNIMDITEWLRSL